MKKTAILMSLAIISFTSAWAQTDSEQLNMELVVSDEETTALFVAFTVAIIGICVFLARDIILGKKTSYDSKEFESKKDKTYEKYHSDWNDDYEELGTRKNTPADKEFLKAAHDSSLPDYYKILGLQRDATQSEIKHKYRELAKKSHPDKTRDEEAEDSMARINKAYEVLSDRELRSKYDSYLD